MRRFVALTFMVGAVLIAPMQPALAATCSPVSGTGEIESDFDGDGYQDAAIGSPGEDDGSITDAGAVQVIYGAGSGLTSADDRLFTQNTSGVPGISEAFDGWGETLAAGDFNFDGYCDLAIGAPQEGEGSAYGAGRVTILFGSSVGLRSRGAQSFAQRTTGVPGTAEPQDGFGRGLAAGQFGRGRATDLAVGAPNEDFGGLWEAGQVHVFYGTSSGLTTDGTQVIHQNTRGIGNTAQDSDRFGGVMAAGNVGKSAYHDLVLGLPNESISAVAEAGAIQVLFGTKDGFTTVDLFIDQESEGILGDPETKGYFGTSVAIADFGKSETNDIAIGVPGATVGDDANAGQVQVVYCNDRGPTTVDQLWSQDSSDVPDEAELGDLFGYRLAAGNLGRTGTADLVVAAVGEDTGTVSNAGAVTVLYGTSTGLAATDAAHIDQDGTDDAAEADEFWGKGGLLVRNVGGGSNADLIVAAVEEEIDADPADHGAIQVFYGSQAGLSEASSDLWHPDSAGIIGANEAGDRWGLLGNNSSHEYDLF